METLEFQNLTQVPSNLVFYPDFIIASMLSVGLCRVEFDLAQQKNNLIDFILTEHKTSFTRTIIQVSSSHSRPTLARFAVFSKLDNLYAGHKFFSCDFEKEGKLRPHRFSLFLCNEPTMGFWLKLYLYRIDGLSLC